MGLGKHKIDLLRDFVNYICECCHKNEEEVGKLIPHRLTRGNKNGKYELRNIKMTCRKCHKKLHEMEFL